MANAVLTVLKDLVTPQFLDLALQNRETLPQEKNLKCSKMSSEYMYE